MTNFLYNPDRKSKEQLKAEFVVRTNVLNEIIDDLETSEMEVPEQHYLLVGQRGSGKTTLLNRIKYAIEDSNKLSAWIIPVIFSEEQYNITELANLWENVGQFLEDYHGFDSLSGKINKSIGEADFEGKSYEILEKELQSRNKKLVLLIDNIGDFLRKLEDKEVRRFRELLQTKSEIRLIAGSSFYLESMLDYKQPFFEFFKVLRLDSLSQSETQGLLKKLGEVYNSEDKINTIIKDSPERIETLRILTGGVPRTIALMFKIFVDYEHDSSLRDLEKILDAVTPLYKHRMDDLPTQQQKIVDAVAKHWDAISVKDLKAKVRLESKTISAQLGQLEKNQIIEKRESGTKNHLYLIKERFFNIWYLMRYGRKFDKQRVIWLVKFMENWCSDAELEFRILDYVKKLKEGKLDEDSVSFYGQVYTAFNKLHPKLRVLLKNSAPNHITGDIILSGEELRRAFKEYVKAEAWQDALEIVCDVNFSFDDSTKSSVALAVAKLMATKGKSKVLENIKKKIRESIEAGDSIALSMAEWVIFIPFVALSIIADIYNENLEEPTGMLKIYIEIIEGFDRNASDSEFFMVNHVVCYFLAIRQYNVISELFESGRLNLRERLKPTYYALLYLRDNKKPPIGGELEEPIGDVVGEIATIRTKIEEFRKQKAVI